MNYLCNKIGITKETADYIHSIYKGIAHNKKAYSDLIYATNNFLSKNSMEYQSYIERIHEETGLKIYAINMILVLMCAKKIKTVYDKKGISEQIYFDTMSDISCKIQECKKLYDIWGIFSLEWYRGIFTLRTFKLGRLEFEISSFPFENYKDVIKKDEIAYRCYIPSSGPLTPESVIDSLKKAYDFFKIKGNMKVFCKSWLLYPAHYELFPSGSNLGSFFDLFHIIYEKKDANNSNLWRIFYKTPETPTNELPANTTLQRNFKEYLINGNNIGIGTGVLMFDGEEVIKF